MCTVTHFVGKFSTLLQGLYYTIRHLYLTNSEYTLEPPNPKKSTGVKCVVNVAVTALYISRIILIYVDYRDYDYESLNSIYHTVY